MKLRNKKTGEIMDDAQYRNYSLHNGFGFRLGDKEYEYHTLAELNEEWEDYEEPKEYWTIDWTCTGVTTNKYSGDDVDDFNKSIGNYFETKEEAEKAVEKLKAWKRLKDKGFRFIDHIDRDNGQGMTRYEWNGYIDGEDLDLLFGGEEQ